MRLIGIVLASALMLHGCGGGSSSGTAQAQPIPETRPITVTPPPVPPPPSSPVGPAPFGAPFVTLLTQDGVGWSGCQTYEAPKDGTGCFIQFLVRNNAGRWLSGVTLNGGLIDATSGREQGDLDIGFFVDGAPAVIAVTGKWQGAPAGLLMAPSDFLSLGGPENRWKDIALTEHTCPPSVPSGLTRCVSVNGGSVPIYP